MHQYSWWGCSAVILKGTTSVPPELRDSWGGGGSVGSCSPGPSSSSYRNTLVKHLMKTPNYIKVRYPSVTLVLCRGISEMDTTDQQEQLHISQAVDFPEDDHNTFGLMSTDVGDQHLGPKSQDIQAGYRFSNMWFRTVDCLVSGELKLYSKIMSAPSQKPTNSPRIQRLIQQRGMTYHSNTKPYKDLCNKKEIVECALRGVFS